MECQIRNKTVSSYSLRCVTEPSDAVNGAMAKQTEGCRIALS
jgi:hypothetical protein